MINKAQLPKNVLIVDDDQSISQMLSMLLETKGYNVSVAASGKELFDSVSHSTDFIILDFSLPDQDGFDICRRLKDEENTRHIPVIILSGQMVARDVVEGLYLGADDCLLKPVECEELVARMEAIGRRNNYKKDQSFRNREKEIICELARIIGEEDVVPNFQPIVNFSNYTVVGLEALCRPNTDTFLSNPEQLFKMAFKYGMYQQLELLSWKKAIEYAAQYIGDVKLFLNCNPYMVEADRLADVMGILKNLSVHPHNIVLEITERSAISDYALFYEKLRGYRVEGFQFAVDDVGGGFASLESIVQTKPEVLKIDRHIIKDLYTDVYKSSIVKFILAFCKENNITCVAEGIETKKEFDFLQGLGVNAGQGYYLYKPTPHIDLIDIQEKIWNC